EVPHLCVLVWKAIPASSARVPSALDSESRGAGRPAVAIPIHAGTLAPRCLTAAVAVTHMTNENDSGPRKRSPQKLVEAYDDVVKRYEREGGRRYEGDPRAERSKRIEQRLAAPAMRDRTHCRVSEIIDHCVPDNNPQKRAVYFRAFELALTTGLFSE